MTDKESRFHHIDILVEDSGHAYSHLTERFEAAAGADADNNLDHDWQSIRASLGEEVSEEEFREYMAWKADQAKDDYYQQQADELLERHEQNDKE